MFLVEWDQLRKLVGLCIFSKQRHLRQYSINDRGSWNDVTWPCTIVNSAPAQATLLTVSFDTDITLTAVNQFFICGSEWIQIGRILNSGIAAPLRYSSYEEYIKKRIAAAARS